MTVIVNKGSTFTITPTGGLTLTADSTIAGTGFSGGILVGAGTISGPFELLNLGAIEPTRGPIDINTGTFDNEGVVDAASYDVTIESGVAIPNLSAGILTGGTWEVSGADISFPTGPITTLNAFVDMLGTGTIEDFVVGSIQPIQNSVSVIGTAGVLQLESANWSAPGSLRNDGTVILSDATVSTAGGLTISPTGQLLAYDTDTINGPLVNNGTVDAIGGLRLAGSLSGNGLLEGSFTLPASQTYDQSFVSPNGFTSSIGIYSPTEGGTATFAGSLSGNWQFGISGGTNAAAPTALELAPSISYNVSFDDNHDELILDSPSGFGGTLSNVTNNSTIVLDGIIGNGASLNLNSPLPPNVESGGVLSITENGSQVGTLTIYGATLDILKVMGADYFNASFTATPNIGLNNTTITVSGVDIIVCFRAGTRIATPRGDILVERLKVGDRVLTHSSGEKAIVWIGRRGIDCRRHPDPVRILPVRIAAHAFGPGLPRRDLFLSPGHAVFVDGDLIPVKCLLNGTTIRQVPARQVTYFHIELDDHEVIFAEGLATESYLDTGNRPDFANGGPSLALYPDLSAITWETASCAPIVLAGPRLEAARARLADRALAPRPSEREDIITLAA
jgi:collagen type I/II/III/V/XI/XXIV/XXVII alpha